MKGDGIPASNRSPHLYKCTVLVLVIKYFVYFALVELQLLRDTSVLVTFSQLKYQKI